MTFDRRGVHIEQCENCRGIFLDQGELEQIVNAEDHHYGMPAYGGHSDSPGPYQGRRDSPPPYGRAPHRDSPPPYGGHHRDSPPPYGGRRRKRSFLEELFD